MRSVDIVKSSNNYAILGVRGLLPFLFDAY